MGGDKLKAYDILMDILQDKNLDLDIDAMSNLKEENVKYCILHHSGVSADQSSSTIDVHHKGHGWLGFGYHGLVRQDGSAEKGRPLNKQGVHTSGYNHNSVAFCITGNYDIDDPKDRPEQFETVIKIVSLVRKIFPEIQVIGHNDKQRTICPGDNFPLDEIREKSKHTSDLFDDVPKDSIYYEYVKFAKEKGLMKGFGDGTFRGEKQMSRYHQAVVLKRLYDMLGGEK